MIWFDTICSLGLKEWDTNSWPTKWNTYDNIFLRSIKIKPNLLFNIHGAIQQMPFYIWSYYIEAQNETLI
jgi:hypothetical protein